MRSLAAITTILHQYYISGTGGTLTAIRGWRIAIYSQDSLGLGHLRRNIRIAKRLLGQAPESSVLLLADSPVAPFFRLPAGVDHVKLPSIQKVSAGVWKPVQLRTSIDDVQRVRTGLLRSVLIDYRPDLLLVDHMPGGARGELIPALDAFKKVCPDSHVVLGLRDILDDRNVIREVWKRERSYEILRSYYDQVLVYGCREVFDTVEAYNISGSVRDTHYCGYVADSGSADGGAEAGHDAWDAEGKFVFVCLGGGADGQLLVRTYVQAIRLLGRATDFMTLIAVGVNASPDVLQEAKTNVEDLPIRAVAYVEDSVPYMAAADLVVSMCGYNTVAEILKLRKKALVVPRPGPSAEQRLRATLFAGRGLIDMIDPEHLSPETMAQRLLADLERSDYPVDDHAVRFSGAEQAADRLLELAV